MAGTADNLTPAEKIAVMGFMEKEVLKIAKANGFKGIFTTNTSPLTQQLGTDVLGYQVMFEAQANKFIDSHGNQTFRKAPDSQKAIVMYKKLK
jgi:hypothetical protein